MHYEINVSKNGGHLFATHERSIVSFEKLKEVVSIFQEKFPENEGYEVSVTEWSCTGKSVDLSL